MLLCCTWKVGVLVAHTLYIMRRKQAGDSHAQKWWPLNVKKFLHTNSETEYFFLFGGTVNIFSNLQNLKMIIKCKKACL